MSDELTAIKAMKELMADIGRPRSNLSQVALWEELATLQQDKASHTYMVNNQAVVIPKTIDAYALSRNLALYSLSLEPQGHP